ncbi:MAG: integrase [Pseudohongiella sp.]|nr:integrase [Pseudohongiella sp.]|tara:strand:- start:18203 stop:18937 length:735 start_codon:yes stop_codon:yes gene_type:complete
MVHSPTKNHRFSQGSKQLFAPSEPPTAEFPIQIVHIDWDRLRAKRPILLETVQQMPAYLIKPEVLFLLEEERDPTYRLIIDLMWSTGARISEVLALKRDSFVDDGYGYGVILTSLKQKPGRPSKLSLQRSPKRYIPILDNQLIDKIHVYLYKGKFRQGQRIFPMTRQTVNRRIKALWERVGGEVPFPISCHTFRHSFAVHLLLHGRPLKYVGQLLGHKSISSTEIYTNVLTIDGEHFLRGVDFH